MKKIFTLLIAALFAINVNAQKVITNDFDMNSRISKIITEQTGQTDPVKEFVIEKLIDFSSTLKESPIYKSSYQKMDSLIYFGELNLDGIIGGKDELPASLLSYFTYLENGYTDEEHIAIWDSTTNGWMDLIKLKVNYNEDNSAKEVVASIFIEEMSTWIEFAKAEFVYDNDGNVSEIDLSMLDQDSFQFVDLLKILFTTQDGLVSEILVKMYDTDNGVWVDMAQLDLTYNEQNYIAQLMVMASQLPKEMNKVAKIVMAYENNKIAKFTDYVWNDSLESWDKVAKEVYSYDDNGNVEKILTSQLLEDGITWYDVAKEVFEYNNDYSYDQLILPYMYLMKKNDYLGEGSLFNHMLTKIKSFVNMPTKEEWVMNGEVDFYYSAGEFTGVNKINNEKLVSVYPNPVQDFIEFKMSSPDTYQFNMYDVTGKTVISREVKNGDEISVSNLNSGVYFYKINNENYNYSGKIVKR